ncbi:MAG TPA: hypothetical protein VEQ10_04310 [Vicinamibacteria bacterium]|nr:hypothetical protein [Vicinamibacteria bacterium]
MPGRLPTWRILREIDLGAVRAEADRPFRVQLLAETRGEADQLARLLTGDADSRPHPWLLSSAAELEAGAAPLPELAVLLSRAPELPPRLAIAAEGLGRHRVPMVTVVVGGSSAADGVVRPGEAARAAVPALSAKHLEAVAQAVASGAPPELRLAMARQLPPLRQPVIAGVIEQTARANALFALGSGVAESVPLLTLPLNVGDIVVLTKNQVVMSYRIALAGGRKGTARAVLGQTLGVVGSGFLLRQLARQLVGLVPVIGIAPKVAVSYAGTWAVGRAVAAWAAGGPPVTRDSVKRFYAEALQRGRQVASAFSWARRARRVRRILR